MNKNAYLERIYSGILGKIIGVYLGRPVEGWTYAHINNRFGMIHGYVGGELGIPLHVPDDDISGTFTFNRTLDDADDLTNVTSADFGKAWLNYLIENKSVFWWGGFGRSTENTAFLRLKEGFEAPQSGSIELNGAAVAEQIGAQIFMDAIPMVFPNDPVTALRYVKALSSVSHDGRAVECAEFLAAMESMAFSISDINELFDSAIASFAWTNELLCLIENVRRTASSVANWTEMREWLEESYSYSYFPGNCHVIPNFALIVAALVMGGNSFRKALEYTVSSGWDTDCNAANVGCINAIRLGLDEIINEYDFKSPVADWFYVINAVGGECVSDAEKEAKRIYTQHVRYYRDWEKLDLDEDFSFSIRGSVQGFVYCPECDSQAEEILNNANWSIPEKKGLLINLEKGKRAISRLTFIDEGDRFGGYPLMGSPELYSGQRLTIKLSVPQGSASLVPYVIIVDTNDEKRVIRGDSYSALSNGQISWIVPDTMGMPIVRVGVEVTPCKGCGCAILESLAISGSPDFHLSGSLINSERNCASFVLNEFTSSCSHFSFDRRHTLVVSHDKDEWGIVDIGNRKWVNYRFSAVVNPSINNAFALVFRTNGHMKYYAVVFEGYSSIQLIRCECREILVLATSKLSYELNTDMKIEISVVDSFIQVNVDGKNLIQASDAFFSAGGVGFAVKRGTILVDSITINGF